MRTEAFIRSELQAFHKRVTACHGQPMDLTELNEVVTTLLKEHRKDMLTQMIRSWLPGELRLMEKVLTEVANQAAAASSKPEPTKMRSKTKTAQEAFEDL